AGSTGSRRLAQGSLQTLLHESLLGSIDGGRTDTDVSRDLLVGRASVSRQQRLCPLKSPYGTLPTLDQFQKLGAFIGVERHAIPNIHAGSFTEPLIKFRRRWQVRQPHPSPSPKASTWPSSTRTRSSTDARPPKPTCSASSALRRRVFTTWSR